ncbi:MAG: methyltransferase [Candidatus Woesearchaeota archaeon]
MILREALKKKLNAKELSQLITSFDIIGDIAIIEIPPVLTKKAKVIGETLLMLHKNIKVVAAKKGEHRGKYRRQKLRIIAGEKRFETLHKESGILMQLNVAKCYFSPRLGSERMRIAKQVRKGEKILVAGSGVAPYPLVISKHSPAKSIVAVEANPIAHSYARKNIALNKASNIVLVKGDINKLPPSKFDRIILAIPHEGIKLYQTLMKFAKKNTILHIYDFAPEENLLLPALKLKGIKILRVVKTQQVGVRRYRVCIDAKVIQTS